QRQASARERWLRDRKHCSRRARERTMPITPFLNGEQFDPKTRRVLGVALEMTCNALQTGDCDDGIRQAITIKIIDHAKAGERNPDILCEQALARIRWCQE